MLSTAPDPEEQGSRSPSEGIVLPQLSALQILKHSLKLSLPIVGNQIFLTAGNFAGSLMIARLGRNTLAASALISSIQSVLVVVVISPLNAAGSIFGKKYGEMKVLLQNEEAWEAADKAYEIGSVYQQSQVLASLLCIPTMLAMAFIGPFLKAVGQDEEITDIVQSFFNALVWSMPPTAWVANTRTLAMSVDSQVLVFSVGALGFGAFIGSSYMLIFGAGGAPQLGVVGLAWASTVRAWVTLTAFNAAFLFQKKYQAYHLFKARLLSNLPNLKELWRIGWPIGIQQAGELGNILATTVLVGRLGTVALAARGISSQYQNLLVIPLYALAQSSAVLVSQSWGKKNWQEMKHFGMAQVMLGAGLSLLIFVSFGIFLQEYISFFLNLEDPNNQPIEELLEKYVLLLTMGGFVFDSLKSIASGELRGIKDTRFASASSILSLWGISFPLAYFMGIVLNLGYNAIVVANDIGLVVGAAAVSHRLFTQMRGLSFDLEQGEHHTRDLGDRSQQTSAYFSFFACCPKKNRIEKNRDDLSLEPSEGPPPSRSIFSIFTDCRRRRSAEKVPLIGQSTPRRCG